MKAVFFFLSLIFALSSIDNARADVPPWEENSDEDSDEPYSYYAQNQNIETVLRDFARSVKTPLTLHGTFEGTLDGSRQAASPSQFLDTLAEDYQFVWYYDGTRLLIYSPDKMEERRYTVRFKSADDLRQRILDSPHWDTRFLLDIDDDGKTVIAKGPPRMLDLIRHVATHIYQPHDAATRVFHLQHAWAADKSFTYRDKTLVLPGVASILKNLLSSGGGTASPHKSAGSTSTNILSGLGGILGRGKEKEKSAQPKKDDNPARLPLIGRIEADPRLNAVIVYDLEAHMPLYQDIINNLDKPTGLVEIKAAIIDINTERMRNLGISWRGRNNNNIAAGYGTINDELSVGTIAAYIGQNADPVALTVTGARYFLSQVRLLQKEGDAHIKAQPAVLTIDNFEALLDLNQTFHVRVQGKEAVDLFPVTTGTLMRVTPHIVTQDDKQAVHMAIAIEDGSILEGTVDDIPIVRNNAINTQALVENNESLLIGGYYFERNEDSETRIPILGDIPFLGRLFSSRSQTKIYNERLYMITPRIVPVPFASP